jgi:pimeloyl-ACP methyl ester carboxylesterase
MTSSDTLSNNTLPSDAAVPPLRRLAAELPAMLRRPFWAPACTRIANAHRGDGRAVMVIPGFLSGDALTSRLRRTLTVAGYRAEGWGLGINSGVRADLLEQLGERLREMATGPGGVVLIGWSLGGLYARELAKVHPGMVDRVITLGSPFHGDPHANRAWRMYERVNGHTVDAPPLDVDLATKPPVPTYALWTRLDGIVAPAATRGVAGESDWMVEVDCHHIDFCSHPAAMEAILAAISAGTAPRPQREP